MTFTAADKAHSTMPWQQAVFTGSTYAGLDPMQMRGITGMGAFGDRSLGLGSSFMDTGQGFAQNAQSIFDRAGGRTLDDAVDYAASSPQAQSLIEAAMRNSTRRLEEQTLPGIDSPHQAQATPTHHEQVWQKPSHKGPTMTAVLT